MAKTTAPAKKEAAPAKAAAPAKVNAATQAIRDERAVAKAAGKAYTAPATKEARAAVKGVNADTQASRLNRATINRQASEATAKTAANKAAATTKNEDGTETVGDYKTEARPAKYVKPATKATGITAVIRKDRAEIKAAGGTYTRSTSGLSKQSIALRKNAGVNERLLSLRASKKSIPKRSNG